MATAKEPWLGKQDWADGCIRASTGNLAGSLIVTFFSARSVCVFFEFPVGRRVSSSWGLFRGLSWQSRAGHAGPV
jgi:hypothetical protein